MKTKLFVVSVMLLCLSGYSHSNLYKCVSPDGEMTLQSMRCASGDESSVMKITPYKNSKKAQTKARPLKAVKKAPPGRWVSVSNATLVANILEYGRFEMTTVSGDKLIGIWEIGLNNTFYVKANSAEGRVAINMKYDPSDDSLRLSQPASPDTFEVYKRR